MPFSVFGFRFSVKKTRIISRLKLKFIAFETELGITQKIYLFPGGAGLHARTSLNAHVSW
jgi:hypothetical protein